MSELRQAYERMKAEQPECPSAETIRLHAEGRLTGEEARRVAFHLNDCAGCVGLLERLHPLDPPELPDDLREEMAGEIGRRLGFEVEAAAGKGGGWLGRVLGMRVPALVPLALAVLALAVWWVGGSRPAEDVAQPIRQLPIFSFDQALDRSGEGSRAGFAVRAGQPFLLEVFFDRLGLDPGDQLGFTVTGEGDTPVFDGETAVLEDYNVRLALTFNSPGGYTITFAGRQGEEPGSVSIEVEPGD